MIFIMRTNMIFLFILISLKSFALDINSIEKFALNEAVFNSKIVSDGIINNYNKSIKIDNTKLNFSLESLKLIDEYLLQFHNSSPEKKSINSVSALIANKDIKTFTRFLGSYVGEVIRTNIKTEATWITLDAYDVIMPNMVKGIDRNNPFPYNYFLMVGKEKTAIFPDAKVLKFLLNGSEDSLYFFATSVLSISK